VFLIFKIKNHPAWFVDLTVKHDFWVIRLTHSKKSVIIPLHTPDTFLEASAPEKLPSSKKFFSKKKNFEFKKINDGISRNISSI
jgi:hypothetical protein